MVKKRQKIILVPSPSLLLFLLSPILPIKPSVNKDDESKDKDIKEPVEIEDEDINSPSPSLPLPPPLVRFISV